jgi:hypothetical protein
MRQAIAQIQRLGKPKRHDLLSVKKSGCQKIIEALLQFAVQE